MSYSSPLTYTFTITGIAVAVALSIHEVKAPPGKTGRLVMMSITHLGVTGAPWKFIVGTAADPDAYGTMDLGDGAASKSEFIRGVDDRIPEGTIVQIGTDGGATNGIADMNVVIEWS